MRHYTNGIYNAFKDNIYLAFTKKKLCKIRQENNDWHFDWHYDISAEVLCTILVIKHASFKYIDTIVTNDTIYNLSSA